MVGLVEPKKLFKEAEKLLKQDRQEVYGDAYDNYVRIGIMWSGILDTYISAEQVALMMATLKIYRASQNPNHSDSFVDAAAYIAIAAQASSSSSSSSSPSTKEAL